MKAQVSDDRAGWETPVWSPLLSDEPSSAVRPYVSPELAAARAALANTASSGPAADEERARLRRRICLASGVDPKDICPVMGYDLSADAFQRARDGWAEHLTAHRPSDWTYAEYDRARAFWAEARPDLIATWPDMTALRLAAFTTLAITWRRHLRGNSEAEEQSAVAYIKPRIQDADERTAILAALGLTAASTGLLALGRRIQTGGPRG